MTIPTRAHLATLLCLCLAPVLHAQTTLRVQTRIVLLDVSVTDKDGHPVTDLTRDDFHVFESEVEQRIASFEPPSEHNLPGTTGPANTPGAPAPMLVSSTPDLVKIGSAPVTLFALDELNMKFADQRFAQDQLEAWLARQPAVLGQPTSLTAVTYTGTTLLADFTQDRDKLLNVLKHHSAGQLWRGGIEESGSFGGQATEKTFATLGAVEQLTQATRGIAGRKNLIWVGDGFPSLDSSQAGREASDKLADAIKHLSAALLHAHVSLDIIGPTVHAITVQVIETDQQGLLAGNSYNTLLGSGDVEFAGLAPPTGGHAYRGSNDLVTAIARSVNEGATYYTLSYRPSDESARTGAYRKIVVTVSRPGVTVNSRDGFYQEPPPGAEPPKLDKQQLSFDLFGAALSKIPYVGLHLTAARGTGAGDWVVAAQARDLGWQPQPDGKPFRADTIVLAASLDAHGKLLAKNFAELTSTTEAQGVQLIGRTVPLHIKVPIQPIGTVRIRFVVRDMADGKLGTADATP